MNKFYQQSPGLYRNGQFTITRETRDGRTVWVVRFAGKEIETAETLKEAKAICK